MPTRPRSGRRLAGIALFMALLAVAALLYARRGGGHPQTTGERAAGVDGADPDGLGDFWGGPGAELSSDQPERSLEELCTWLYEGGNKYFGRTHVLQSQEGLATAEASGDPDRICRALWILAEAYLAYGDNQEAVESYTRGVALAESGAARADAFAMRLGLAVAWLRSGEVTHCVADHNAARCLFPIVNEGVWDDVEPANQAVRLLEQCLAERPDSASARWLLNVAHMARGSYPEGVDPALLIEVPESPPELRVPRFHDVAKQLGLDTFDLAGGAVMDDVDGDGFLDIVTTTIDPCGQMRYFHSEGDGSFADWTERAGLIGQLGGLNLAQADYDGDGRLDLFVFRGAWLGPILGAHPNGLLRQQPDGSFEDVGVASGVGARRFPCATGSWQDYDRDGDLDIFVGAEAGKSQLLRNEDDGTFTDVAEQAGVTNDSMTKGAAWGDYDGDGDADLYVSNLGGSNRLYRNDADGTFAEVTEEAGLESGRSLTFGCWFFDHDNDGRLDLFVAGFGANLDGFVSDYLGEPSNGERLRLYRNTGGRFRSVAEELGLAHVNLPMGANYGDIDNDGWLDIYLGTGKPGYQFLVPNAMYKNVEGRRFADVTTSAGVGHLQKGHGVAFGDIDNDGDQDLLAQMGGFYRADGFHDALFENQGRKGEQAHWVTLVLRDEGTRNRFGVGARVRVDVLRPGGERRSMHLVVGSGGSFGASSLQQEVGLDDAVAIERVEILWPDDGERQVLDEVPLDAFVEVVRGAASVRRLERRRLRFAAD